MNLQVDFGVVSRILALRPALENLIVQATSNPESVAEPGPAESELMGVVRALSKPSASKFGLKMEETDVGWILAYKISCCEVQ